MPTIKNIAQSNTTTVAVTIPTDPYRMLVLLHQAHANAAGGNPAVSTAVLDPTGLNIPLTYKPARQTRTVGGVDYTSEIWYLLDPPPGSYNVVVTTVNASSVNHYCFTCISVDTSNPFRSAAVGATGNDAAPTVNVSSMPTDLVVDSLTYANFGAAAVGAGQTAIGITQALTAGMAWASQEAGAAPTVTMSWTLAGAIDWVIDSVSIIHKSDTRGRIVKYHTCIWDPIRRILDSMGGYMEVYNVRPDNYCHFQGRETPTTTEYENLNDNPAIEYLEEVTWGSRMEIPTMKGNRNQLTEIKMAMLTKGGTT